MKLVAGSLVMCLCLMACAETVAPTDEAPVEAAPVPVVSAQAKSSARRTTTTLARTSFATLIQKGVTTGPVSRASGASLQAASAQIASERSSLRPQLSLEGSASSSGTTAPILRLSKIIYDGGRVNERVALRRLEGQQVYQGEVVDLGARAFQAVEAVINLQRDRALAAQARRNAKLTSEFVALLQERFDAGAGSLADVLAAKGRLSNAMADQEQASTEVMLSQADWVEVFGTSPGKIPNVPDAPKLRKPGVAYALQGSPRLREQALAIATRQKELDLANMSNRPTISAILETDFNQGAIPNGAQARLGVSVPIYQGGLRQSTIEGATAQLSQEIATQDSLERELTRAIAQAQAETNSIKSRLATTRTAVKLNEDALDAAKGEFELGKGTYVQIIDALRELNEAQVRLITQSSEARRAEYAILAVTGDLIDVLGIIRPARPQNFDTDAS